MENKFDAEYFKHHADEKVRLLWLSYEKMSVGLLSEMYLAIRMTVKTWNQELAKGNIHLIAKEKDKSFDNAHKYFTEYPLYLKSIQSLEAALTPEELKEVDNKLAEPKSVSELMHENV